MGDETEARRDRGEFRIEVGVSTTKTQIGKTRGKRQYSVCDAERSRRNEDQSGSGDGRGCDARSLHEYQSKGVPWTMSGTRRGCGGKTTRRDFASRSSSSWLAGQFVSVDGPANIRGEVYWTHGA